MFNLVCNQLTHGRRKERLAVSNLGFAPCTEWVVLSRRPGEWQQRGSDANMIIWVQGLTPSCQVTQLENCFRTSNSFLLLLRDWVGVREEKKKKRWTLDFGSDFMDSCLPKARDFEDSPCVKEVRVESLPYAWDGSGPWRDNKMDQVPNLMELPFGSGFS